MNPIFTDLEGNKIQINENDRYYKNHRFLFQCRLHRYTSFHIPYKPNTIHFEKDIFYETRILVQRFPNRYKKLKYATLSFSGYLKNDFTFQINAKCHSLYGMKEKSFTFSVKTINNTPELLTTNIPLNGIKDTKLDFSINVKDSNITSLNQETFYITNENIFLENMTYDEDICTIDASIRFHESGTKQTLFRIGDTDNALTDEGKIISNIFDQLPDIIFDSFETENIDIDISNLLTIDNEDTIQVYIDNTNVFTVTTQSTIVTIHNPFIHSGKLYGNFSTTIPIHTLSSKTLVLSIKVNGNIYQESKIEIFSAVNAFRNTSTKFEQIEKFIEYNILKMNIIHKYRDISFLKGNNFNYIDFKYYENTYNTNLELKNYFTALEAKSSFDTGEFAWYNNSREKISDTYSHTANIGDYYKIYLEGKVLYQSKIFTETIETDIFHDLYYHSGFIFNENIHRVVNEYITKPTLTHQLYGDIKNWDVSNVDNFSHLFSNKSITFDLSKWDISNGKTFDNMFANNRGNSGNFQSLLDKIHIQESISANNLFEGIVVPPEIVESIFNYPTPIENILKNVEIDQSSLQKIAQNKEKAQTLYGEATEWKTTIKDLKDSGFDAKELYDLGFRNLQEAFSIDEVIDLSVQEIKNMYSLEDMSTVYSVEDLRKNNFTALQIHLAGNIDIPTLIAGGFTDISNFADKAFNTMDLKNQGFTAFKFAEIDYNISELRNLGFVNNDFVKLKGSEIEFIYQFQEYNDQGLQILYGSYILDDTQLDNEIENTYTVFYNITFEDNETFAVARNVKVIDNISPTVTSFSLVKSDVPIDLNTPLKKNDKITFSIEFSEDVQNVSISMEGSQYVEYLEIEDHKNNRIFELEYTITDGNGQCNFTISATDKSEYGYSVQYPGSFFVDNTVPQITSKLLFKILSSSDETQIDIIKNEEQSWSKIPFKTNDTLKIELEFSESVTSSANIFYNGNNYSMVKNIDTDHIFQYNINFTGDNVATVQINASDSAGNEIAENIYIQIDNTPPSFDGNIIVSQGYFKNYDEITFSAKMQEKVSKAFYEITGHNEIEETSMTLDNQTMTSGNFTIGANKKITSGNMTITVTGFDITGNSNSTQKVIFIDNDKPSFVDTTILYNHQHTIKPLTVNDTLKITTKFDKSIKEVTFNGKNMDKNESEEYYTDYTVTQDTPQGQFDVNLIATDLAGNANEYETVINIDKEKPQFETFKITKRKIVDGSSQDTVLQNSNFHFRKQDILIVEAVFNEQVQNVSIKINNTDYPVSQNTENTENIQNQYIYTYEIKEDSGTYPIQITAFDLAGNKNVEIKDITIDNEKPVMRVTISQYELEMVLDDSTVDTSFIVFSDISGIELYTDNNGNNFILNKPFKQNDKILIQVYLDKKVQENTVKINMTGGNILTSQNLSKVNDTLYKYEHTVQDGNGDCQITIKAKDLAGNEKEIIETIIIDNEKPTMEFSVSQDGISNLSKPFKKNDNILLQADFDKKVQPPRIKLSGENTVEIVKMTKKTDTLYTYEHTVQDGNGDCEITIEAKDAAGNSDTFSNFISIDNTPPDIFLVVKQYGKIVHLNDIDISDNQIKLDLSGNNFYSDLSGNEYYLKKSFKKNDEIEIEVHSNKIMDNVFIELTGQNELASEPMQKQSDTIYTYIHTIGEGNGICQILIESFDLAGNFKNLEENIEIDNIGPVIELTISQITPNSGEIFDIKPYKKDDNLKITATFDKEVQKNVVLKIKEDTFSMEKIRYNIYTLNYTVDSIINETIYLQVDAYDLAGNFSNKSDISFIVDNNPPYLISHKFLKNDVLNLTTDMFPYKKNDKFTLKLVFSEPMSEVEVKLIGTENTQNQFVKIYSDSNTSNQEFSYIKDIESGATGNSTIMIKAYDLARNQYSQSNYELPFSIDNTTPSIISTNINKNYFKDGDNVNFTATFSEPVNILSDSILSYNKNNGESVVINLGTTDFQNTVNVSHTIASNNIETDDLKISIFYKDKAGNQNKGDFTYTIDNVKPNITIDLEKTFFKKGDPVNMDLNFDEDVNSIDITVLGNNIDYSDIITPQQPVETYGYNDFSIPDNITSDGESRITVIATDLAGNQNSVSEVIYIDVTNPSKPSINSSKYHINNSEKEFNIFGEAEIGSTVTLFADNQEIDSVNQDIGSYTIDTNGNYMMDTSGNSYSTTYSFTQTIQSNTEFYVIAKDAAGNSKASDKITIYFDTTAPDNQNLILTSEQYVQSDKVILINTDNIETGQSVWLAPPNTTTFEKSDFVSLYENDKLLSPKIEQNYYLYVLDLAGNISSPSSHKIIVDNTSPTNENDVFTQDTTVEKGETININQFNEEYVWFAPIDTSEFSEKTTITRSATEFIQAPSVSGIYYLYVMDKAGNISSASTTKLFVKPDKPTLNSIVTEINNSYFTLFGTKEANTGIKIYGSDNTVLASDQDNSETFSFRTSISSTTTFYATAMNGNIESSKSEELSITYNEHLDNIKIYLNKDGEIPQLYDPGNLQSFKENDTIYISAMFNKTFDEIENISIENNTMQKILTNYENNFFHISINSKYLSNENENKYYFKDSADDITTNWVIEFKDSTGSRPLFYNQEFVLKNVSSNTYIKKIEKTDEDGIEYVSSTSDINDATVFQVRHLDTQNKDQSVPILLDTQVVVNADGHNKYTSNCGWYGCRVVKAVSEQDGGIILWMSHGGTDINSNEVITFNQSTDSYASYIYEYTVGTGNKEKKFKIDGNFGETPFQFETKFIIDNSVHLNTFDVNKTDVKNNDTITFTAEFNESVQNVQLHFSINDITATQTMFESQTPNQYYYNYTVGNLINGTNFSQLNGQCTVTLFAEDNLGNSNFNDTSSNQITLTFDNIAPVVPITLTLNNVANSGPFKENDQVVINSNFNEDVYNVQLLIDDVSTDFATTDNKIYNATYTVPSGDKTVTVKVIAEDKAGNSNSNTLNFDVDNTKPEFTSKSTATVNENIVAGTIVYTAAVKLPDDVTFELTDGNDDFTIDGSTGKVSIKESPNFETKDQYTFTVKAIDQAGNSDTHTVTLNIVNIYETSTEVNNVFSSQEVLSVLSDTMITFESLTNKEVWFAPSGTTTFGTENEYMTKMDRTQIKAPSLHGVYYLYIKREDTSGFVSSTNKLMVTGTLNANLILQDNVIQEIDDTTLVSLATPLQADGWTRWFAPANTTNFDSTTATQGYTMTTDTGDETTILAPESEGIYYLYLTKENMVSQPSTNKLVMVNKENLTIILSSTAQEVNGNYFIDESDFMITGKVTCDNSTIDISDLENVTVELYKQGTDTKVNETKLSINGEFIFSVNITQNTNFSCKILNKESSGIGITYDQHTFVFDNSIHFETNRLNSYILSDFPTEFTVNVEENYITENLLKNSSDVTTDQVVRWKYNGETDETEYYLKVWLKGTTSNQKVGIINNVKDYNDINNLKFIYITNDWVQYTIDSVTKQFQMYSLLNLQENIVPVITLPTNTLDGFTSDTYEGFLYPQNNGIYSNPGNGIQINPETQNLNDFTIDIAFNNYGPGGQVGYQSFIELNKDGKNIFKLYRNDGSNYVNIFFNGINIKFTYGTTQGNEIYDNNDNVDIDFYKWYYRITFNQKTKKLKLLAFRSQPDYNVSNWSYDTLSKSKFSRTVDLANYTFDNLSFNKVKLGNADGIKSIKLFNFYDTVLDSDMEFQVLQPQLTSQTDFRYYPTTDIPKTYYPSITPDSIEFDITTQSHSRDSDNIKTTLTIEPSNTSLYGFFSEQLNINYYKNNTTKKLELWVDPITHLPNTSITQQDNKYEINVTEKNVSENLIYYSEDINQDSWAGICGNKLYWNHEIDDIGVLRYPLFSYDFRNFNENGFIGESISNYPITIPSNISFDQAKGIVFPSGTNEPLTIDYQETFENFMLELSYRNDDTATEANDIIIALKKGGLTVFKIERISNTTRGHITVGEESKNFDNTELALYRGNSYIRIIFNKGLLNVLTYKNYQASHLFDTTTLSFDQIVIGEGSLEYVQKFRMYDTIDLSIEEKNFLLDDLKTGNSVGTIVDGTVQYTVQDIVQNNVLFTQYTIGEHTYKPKDHEAPDGSYTAYRLKKVSGSCEYTSQSGQTQGIMNIPLYTHEELTTGNNYLVSIWLKADSECSVDLGITSENPEEKLVTTTWNRYTVSVTYTGQENFATATKIRYLRLFLRTVNNVVYFWHPQVENAISTVASTYISTTNQRLYRLPDNIRYPKTTLDYFMNQTTNLSFTQENNEYTFSTQVDSLRQIADIQLHSSFTHSNVSNLVMSKDGNYIAVCTTTNLKVTLYDLKTNEKVQEFSGSKVALNIDATVVVVGRSESITIDQALNYYNKNGTENYQDVYEIYDFVESQWIVRLLKFYHYNVSQNIGNVELNHDGTILAYTRYTQSTGTAVIIREWKTNQWIDIDQKGNYINPKLNKLGNILVLKKNNEDKLIIFRRDNKTLFESQINFITASTVYHINDTGNILAYLDTNGINVYRIEGNHLISTLNVTEGISSFSMNTSGNQIFLDGQVYQLLLDTYVPIGKKIADNTNFVEQNGDGNKLLVGYSDSFEVYNFTNVTVSDFGDLSDSLLQDLKNDQFPGNQFTDTQKNNLTNDIPTFTVDNIEATVGEIFVLDIPVFDTDICTIEGTVLPEWLTLESSTDNLFKLHGTPTHEHSGINWYTELKIDDQFGSSVTKNFSIQVLKPGNVYLISDQNYGNVFYDNYFDINLKIYDPDMNSNLIKYSTKLNDSNYHNSNPFSTYSNTPDFTYENQAPDGTYTALGFTVPNENNFNNYYGVKTESNIPLGVTYTVSVWAKGAVGGEHMWFGLGDYRNKELILTTQWKRFSFTGMANPEKVYSQRGFQVSTNANEQKTIYLWGPQLEKGKFATAYTRTTDSQVTKNESTLTENGGDPLTGYYNSFTITKTETSNHESKIKDNLSYTFHYNNPSQNTDNTTIELFKNIHNNILSGTLQLLPSSIQKSTLSLSCTVTFEDTINSSHVVKLLLNEISQELSTNDYQTFSFEGEINDTYSAGTKQVFIEVNGLKFRMSESNCSSLQYDGTNFVFTIDQLKQGDVTDAYILSVGYSASELEQAGYSALQLKQAGYSSKEIEDAGYSEEALNAAQIYYPAFENEAFTSIENNTTQNLNFEIKVNQTHCTFRLELQESWLSLSDTVTYSETTTTSSVNLVGTTTGINNLTKNTDIIFTFNIIATNENGSGISKTQNFTLTVTEPETNLTIQTIANLETYEYFKFEQEIKYTLEHPRENILLDSENEFTDYWTLIDNTSNDVLTTPSGTQENLYKATRFINNHYNLNQNTAYTYSTWVKGTTTNQTVNLQGTDFTNITSDWQYITCNFTTSTSNFTKIPMLSYDFRTNNNYFTDSTDSTVKFFKDSVNAIPIYFDTDPDQDINFNVSSINGIERHDDDPTFYPLSTNETFPETILDEFTIELYLRNGTNNGTYSSGSEYFVEFLHNDTRVLSIYRPIGIPALYITVNIEGTNYTEGYYEWGDYQSAAIPAHRDYYYFLIRYENGYINVLSKKRNTSQSLYESTRTLGFDPTKGKINFNKIRLANADLRYFQKFRLYDTAKFTETEIQFLLNNATSALTSTTDNFADDLSTYPELFNYQEKNSFYIYSLSPFYIWHPQIQVSDTNDAVYIKTTTQPVYREPKFYITETIEYKNQLNFNFNPILILNTNNEYSRKLQSREVLRRKGIQTEFNHVSTPGSGDKLYPIEIQLNNIKIPQFNLTILHVTKLNEDERYTLDYLVSSANFHAWMLRLVGYGISLIKDHTNDDGEKSFSDGDILRADFTAGDLYSVDYSASDLRFYKYTIPELQAGEYDDADILSAGYSVQQLAVYYSIEEFRLANYTAKQLSSVYTITELITGGYVDADILAADYSVTDLYNYGYTVNQLYDADYGDYEIFAVYPVNQIRLSGSYTLNDLKRWVQYGSTLFSLTDYNFGYDVSMNTDGNVIAVSSPENGYIKRYKFEDNDWVEYEELTISGVNTLISLDGTGDKIAVANKGVYNYVYSTWELELNESNHSSVALSRDGQTYVGISESSIDIYKYDTTWSFSNTFNGTKVSINNDGTILSILLENKIDVYKYDTEWSALNSIDAVSANSITMDSTGYIIAFSNTSDVFVYEFNNITTNWDQKGDTISNNQFVVTLNDSGNGLFAGNSNSISGYYYTENNWSLSFTVVTSSKLTSLYATENKLISGYENNFVKVYEIDFSNISDSDILADGFSYKTLKASGYTIPALAVANYTIENPSEPTISSSKTATNDSNDILQIYGEADIDTTITLYNGVTQQKTTAAFNGSYSFTTSITTTTEFYVTSTDADAAGITVSSELLQVIFDNTPPTNGDTVFNTDQIVQGDSPVTITASGESEVWFAPQNTTIFTEGDNMTKAAGDATEILAPSSEGTYYLYVIDAAGNVGIGTKTLTVDKTAPNTPTINSNRTNVDDVTVITISGQAENGSTVTLYPNKLKTESDGHYSFTISITRTTTFHVTATDAFNNTSLDSNTITVHHYSATPDKPDITTNKSRVSTNENFTIQGDNADPGCLVWLEISNDDNIFNDIQGPNVVSNQGNYSFPNLQITPAKYFRVRIQNIKGTNLSDSVLVSGYGR